MLYCLKATGIKMNYLTVGSSLNIFHSVTKDSNNTGIGYKNKSPGEKLNYPPNTYINYNGFSLMKE